MGKPQGSDDIGFSLVELVIAMFLLAVIALALLPLMIASTQTSSVNGSLVSATTFANSQLAPIRASYPDDAAGSSCATLRGLARTDVAGPTGSDLVADIVIGACPASGSYPAAIPVTVTVGSSTDSSVTLAEISTYVVAATP